MGVQGEGGKEGRPKGVIFGSAEYMSEERGCLCSYVFMYWSDWSFDGPILQRRSACSLGFDSGVGCISVDNVIGALKD